MKQSTDEENSLSRLINDGYGEQRDLNCAETILYAANQVY